MALTGKWRSSAISAVWAFSEAVFFFIVPDVWLSRISLSGFKSALRPLVFAVIAALAGGTLMYFAGARNVTDAVTFLDAIPGISTAMIGKAEQDIRESGAVYALLSGMMIGYPYKIYAVMAGKLGLSLPFFLAVSAFARALRFAIVSAIYAIGASILKRFCTQRTIVTIYAASWVFFYCLYFYKFGF